MYVTAFSLFFTTILTTKKRFFSLESVTKIVTQRTFIRKNTTSTVQLLKIFKQNYNHFAAKHTYWHWQWCSHGRSHLKRPKHRSLKKKKALRDTLTRVALRGLIYNGKLANQTARLVAIVVKSQLIRFIYLLRSFSYRYQAKSELVSAHNRNGIIE